MRTAGLKTVTYKTPGAGLRWALCLALTAGIALGALAFHARWGVSLPFSLAPRATAAPQPTAAARQTREAALSAHTLYVLQLGAFTQQGAAQQLSQEYAARGAAGYVYRDADAYRVLAAGYPTRAEAQSVQTHLSAQGVSTYIHPFEQGALTLRAGGSAAEVGAFCEALAYLDGLGDKLCALSCALDARETAPDAARAALLSEGATCAALREGLLRAFGGEAPVPLAPLADLLAQVADECGALPADSGAARTGAAVKRCQMIVFFGLAAFAAGMT